MSATEHREVNNERAIEQALGEFAKRLHETLRTHPDMHGSVALTMHCAFGLIKKYEVSVDETRLCKS